MSNVFLKNTTSSPITVAGYTVHYIDSADAEIVEVERSGSSYEEIDLYLPGGNSITYYMQGGITSSYSGTPDGSYLKTLYSDSGLTIPATYDAAKRYELGTYKNDVWTPRTVQSISDMPASTSTSDPVYAWIIYNNSGAANLWFVSNYPTNQINSRFADNPVRFKFRLYSTETVKYNAFKFTANGTDYYYVLDGTQTDWVSDLGSIGYSLTPNYLKGYINSSKTNSYFTRYAEKNLYDNAGNSIIGDSSKTYTIMGIYTANGVAVSYQNASLYAYNNRLQFVWNDSDAYIAYVEYTVS